MISYMKIGICDDDLLHLNYIHTFVSNYLDTTIHQINPLSPKELGILVQTNTFDYNILITDIDMGEQNGIKLVEKINIQHPNCIVIYVSNYLLYATQVYDTKHIYFVLKQELETRLPKALDRALEHYCNTQSTNITFKYQNINYTLPYNDILYFESKGRYILLYTRDREYQFIGALKSLIPTLPYQFHKCHNSYVINLKQVKCLSRTNCKLTNSTIIPISKTYTKQIEQEYIRYLSSPI